MSPSKRELSALQAKLKNARKRARYWSGNPSANGYGYNPCATLRDADIEYELALDDCHALADEIARLTGRRPKITDYREAFTEQFTGRLLPAIARKDASE